MNYKYTLGMLSAATLVALGLAMLHPSDPVLMTEATQIANALA